MLSEQFADFRISASSARRDRPEDFLSSVLTGRYGRLMWPFIAGARGFQRESVQRGLDVVRSIQMRAGTTFQTYTSNTVATPVSQQTMAQPKVQFRRTFGHVSWDEVELQMGGISSANSDSAQMTAFFAMDQKLDEQLNLDCAIGLENQWLGMPTSTGAGNMESLTEGPNVNSLSMLMNGFANNLFVTSGGAFTTKHQLQPATALHETAKHFVFGYNSTAVEPSSGQKNILMAMDDMTSWMGLTQSMTAPVLTTKANDANAMGTKIAFWSPSGRSVILDLLRRRNTAYVQQNVMGMDEPVYGSIPQVVVTGLQSMATYPTGSYTSPTGYVTEGNTNALGRGPHGYVIDTSALEMLFHPDHFFTYRNPTKTGYQQQFWKFTEYLDTYTNFALWCPWKCALIAPGAVDGVFPNQAYTASQVYAAY